MLYVSVQQFAKTPETVFKGVKTHLSHWEYRKYSLDAKENNLVHKSRFENARRNRGSRIDVNSAFAEQ